MSNRLRLAGLRPDDFLFLEFEFDNLQPTAGGSLERIIPGSPALIVIHFPPQHITEQIFGTTTGTPLLRPPVPTAMAKGSRLVFRLPDDTNRLPLTLETLLDWEGWELVTGSGLPGELETAIEFPWRVLLSPEVSARWRHKPTPVTFNGNTQLWNTHLGREVTSPEGKTSIVHGGNVHVLTRIAGNVPFNSSSSLAADGLTDSETLAAESLSLSALGASAHLRGEKYEHIAAQGRDQLVRTVQPGFLCGTGHRAVIVTTAEREPIEKDPETHGTIAYIRERWEVFVEEPEVDYRPMAGAYPYGKREMPFHSIRLLTRSARIQETVGTPFVNPTWLKAPGDKPLFFRAMAIDIAGTQIEFELPLMFVPLEKIDHVRLIRENYYSPPFPPYNITTISRMELHGQLLAMAEAGKRPGSTQVRAEAVTLGLATAFDPESGTGLDADKIPASYRPRYLPYIKDVDASVPSVEDLLGNSHVVKIQHDFNYLMDGFVDVEDEFNNRTTNPAEIFAEIMEPIKLEFASQGGGGLARPNSSANALSRTLGAIAAPKIVDEQDVEPPYIDLSVFGGAKLLGTISLLDIVADDLSLDAASVSSDLPSRADLDNPRFYLNQPRLVTRRIQEEAGFKIESRFLWKPQLKKEQAFDPLKLKLMGADLLLDARTTRSISGESESEVTGRLREAALSFAGVMTVEFGELLFRTAQGRRTEVGAKKVKLTFEGPLEFVNALRSIIPEDGFDDPPFLTVDGQGVIAGYTLGIPTVGVGVFSLQNIALTSAISIPFTDKPAGIRFAISERHKPFLVTVSLFGGGGFFALAVSANGLEQVEASIEFGGNIALNLVIASGGVSVMAGIYFALTANTVTLTGFLRCGGYLEVLGLISVSVEFYLAFSYCRKEQTDNEPAGNEVWGQASLTVCVKIAFFSKSVSLSVERRFAGSDGDPSFADSVSFDAWKEYLLAFA